MRKELISKYKKTIAPATKLEHLYLDHSKSLSFSDRYVFSGQVIGAGGFGVVVSATDKHSREDVAIKILNIELYMSAGAEEEEENLDDAMKLKVERRLNFLETEVSIMQELEHPSIIKVKKIYKSQYHVLIVMELAKCSLADYIEKHGRLTEEESKTVMRQILDGLKYLHISNIVHRDLKPGNILLMSDKDLEGTVKISDFSISAKLTKALHFELTDTVGTFLYKAPEQFDSSLCTTVTPLLPLVFGCVAGGGDTVRNVDRKAPVLPSRRVKERLHRTHQQSSSPPSHPPSKVLLCATVDLPATCSCICATPGRAIATPQLTLWNTRGLAGNRVFRSRLMRWSRGVCLSRPLRCCCLRRA